MTTRFVFINFIKWNSLKVATEITPIELSIFENVLK